jgi:hypothetical protein
MIRPLRREYVPCGLMKNAPKPGPQQVRCWLVGVESRAPDKHAVDLLEQTNRGAWEYVTHRATARLLVCSHQGKPVFSRLLAGDGLGAGSEFAHCYGQSFHALFAVVVGRCV